VQRGQEEKWVLHLEKVWFPPEKPALTIERGPSKTISCISNEETQKKRPKWRLESDTFKANKGFSKWILDDDEDEEEKSEEAPFNRTTRASSLRDMYSKNPRKIVIIDERKSKSRSGSTKGKNSSKKRRSGGIRDTIEAWRHFGGDVTAIKPSTVSKGKRYQRRLQSSPDVASAKRRLMPELFEINEFHEDDGGVFEWDNNGGGMSPIPGWITVDTSQQDYPNGRRKARSAHSSFSSPRWNKKRYSKGSPRDFDLNDLNDFECSIEFDENNCSDELSISSLERMSPLATPKKKKVSPSSKKKKLDRVSRSRQKKTPLTAKQRRWLEDDEENLNSTRRKRASSNNSRKGNKRGTFSSRAWKPYQA